MCINSFLRYGLTLVLTFAMSACGGGGGGGSSSSPNSSTNGGSTIQGTGNSNGSGSTTTAGTGNVQQIVTATSEPVANTQIKLLALYTSGVSDQFNAPDLRIQHMVNVANDVLQQSGVALEFILDHIEWVDYPDDYPITQALDDLTLASHPAFEFIPELRNQTNADLVVLVRPYANDGRCGYAWIGGYQTEGDFVTIMASPTEFNASQLPKLSSPTLSCNGQPCGIAYTDNNGSDAVRALNISKEQVAAYRD